MKYYVVADVHGFYTELIYSLTNKGYFSDKSPHKLIICGDLFDRGNEATKLQSFILDLMKKDEVILIRGNHEDLFLELLENAEDYMTESNVRWTHHWTNGTVQTALQLTEQDLSISTLYPRRFVLKAKNTPYYKKIIPQMIDYFETKKHIFVHGWIPCDIIGSGAKLADTFIYKPDWRIQNKETWEKARWTNGMLAGNKGVIEPDKTIVCGHYHCSYGHKYFEERKADSPTGTDFSPYYGKGIIAIDACTAVSHIVNCIVIEDEPIE